MSLLDRSRSQLARFFPWAYQGNTKHDHYCSFGWPECLNFQHFYRAYTRNSIAAAAVDKTIGKTWETLPEIWEGEKPGDTPDEQAIAEYFYDNAFWRALMIADQRSMVGRYAGAILILRDGSPLDQPVDRVPGGIKGIAKIVPAWEAQLTVAEYDTDPRSENYGEPLFYQFNETAVSANASGYARQLRVHPDRVLIFSEDGTIEGRSMLEAGYNDLIDLEKIKGAGGEGFWKTSRGAPVLEVHKEVDPESIKRMLGTDGIERLDEKVSDFNNGFDTMLLLGGMTAKPLTVTLPQPEQFLNGNLQSFAASVGMPVKVLVGNVTGERASTEDAREWAQTCMSRRSNRVVPVINEMIRRFVAWGILADKSWQVGWTSLVEATPDDKLDRAGKMSAINAQSAGELIFLPDEIREEAGYAASDEIADWEAKFDELEQRRALDQELSEDGASEVTE